MLCRWRHSWRAVQHVSLYRCDEAGADLCGGLAFAGIVRRCHRRAYSFTDNASPRPDILGPYPLPVPPGRRSAPRRSDATVPPYRPCWHAYPNALARRAAGHPFRRCSASRTSPSSPVAAATARRSPSQAGLAYRYRRAAYAAPGIGPIIAISHGSSALLGATLAARRCVCGLAELLIGITALSRRSSDIAEPARPRSICEAVMIETTYWA